MSPWPELLRALPRGASPAPGGWAAAVGVVLERDGVRDAALPEAVRSPDALAEAAVDELVDLLGKPVGAVRALARVAEWWTAQGLDLDGRLPDGTRPDAGVLRSGLTAVRGVSRLLADRLLLHALGVPVLPVSAGLWRIMVRHGWACVEDDPEEWQREAADDIVRLGGSASGAALALDDVARRYCRRRPDCESCPLLPLLPAGGPYDPAA